MNKDNAKDYLPLVQALAEGKVVQINTADGWEDLTAEISLCFAPDQYRIKPEPRELWVVIDNDNDGTHIGFLSEHAAIRDVGSRGVEIRRYREVIE